MVPLVLVLVPTAMDDIVIIDGHSVADDDDDDNDDGDWDDGDV